MVEVDRSITISRPSPSNSGNTYLLTENIAPCHEGTWESGCIAPCIVNLNTGWKWAIGRFTPGARASAAHRTEGWVDPRARLDAVVKRKIAWPGRHLSLILLAFNLYSCHYIDWDIESMYYNEQINVEWNISLLKDFNPSRKSNILNSQICVTYYGHIEFETMHKMI
jgi:hypothetical protein